MVVTSTTQQGHYQLSLNCRATSLIIEPPRGFKVSKPSTQRDDAKALWETTEVPESGLQGCDLYCLFFPQDLDAAFRRNSDVEIHVFGQAPEVSHRTEGSVVTIIELEEACIEQREVCSFEI